MTSLKTNFLGHKKRLEFIKNLNNEVDLDLIATFDYYKRADKTLEFSQFAISQKNLGFNKVVKNKWQALAPYRYSLIIENFRGPNYWSEKLSDCFLAHTMPIYYGCTNLNDYFPKNSFISVDIEDNKSIDRIKKIIKRKLLPSNLQAIEKARNLVLNKFQFFPFFATFIKAWEQKFKSKKRDKESITIPKEDTLMLSGKVALSSRWQNFKVKINKKSQS